VAFLDALLQLEREGLKRPVLGEVGAGDARFEGLFLTGVPLGAQQLGEQRRDRGAVLVGGGEHFVEARGDGLELEVLKQLLQIFIHRRVPDPEGHNRRRSVVARVRGLDLYSLRHTFASLGRTAGESAFNVARMMGHSRSVPVDQVYAHSMQSGMASVAENVTARAFGVKPQLRVIEGGKPDVGEPVDDGSKELKKTA
jgi:hypothetical protein